MVTLVDARLREWTAGLDTQRALISIFEHIRDIPYSLTASGNYHLEPEERILAMGRGSCGPKHYLLAEMYRRLGFEVVFATFPFLWNDPDLEYPPDLRALATGLPVAYHLACRVRIDNRWLLLDATWDRALKQAGFPVNEHWDGLAETICAVKPLRSAIRTAFCRTATNNPYRDVRDLEFNPLDGEQDHADEEERAQYYRQKMTVHSPKEIGQIRRFYHEFDRWMEEVRMPGALPDR
jgi:hypothetical protein